MELEGRVIVCKILDVLGWFSIWVFKFLRDFTFVNEGFRCLMAIKTNVIKIFLKNIHILIANIQKVCYITNIIILNNTTRIYSVIWSERFYLVPNERTGLRVKVFGRSV